LFLKLSHERNFLGFSFREECILDDERNQPMKERRGGTSGIEDSIAYIFGRIEIQIEGFALRMGISAAELAHRVGTLLSAPPVGQILGPGDHLPHLQQAPRERDMHVEPLALASGSHRVEASPAAKPRAGKNGGTFWKKMTEQERSAEMLRRLSKIKTKTPTMRKQIKTIRAKLKDLEPQTEMRHEAKKAGQQWVIYAHPRDYPSKYVMRRWNISAGTMMATEEMALAETLEEIRKHVPPGLFCLRRFEDDDPCIVEVWL
jgi:hypothetical protein